MAETELSEMGLTWGEAQTIAKGQDPVEEGNFCGTIYISRIRRFLSTDTTKALVHTFVTSRVDYCNSLLYGLPPSHLNKVQRILNATARLVCRAPCYCSITLLLYELHWLQVRQRISFKILLFVFKAIHGFAPTYLRELVSIKRSGIII